MPDDPGLRRPALVVALAALALLPGLGGSRLTPHEALWALSAREMIASGDPIVPTLGGTPWLEKPPLATWLIAGSGVAFGRVAEASSRLPSALAAMALCLGVASIASRRLGPRVGLLAGLVQATMPWLVLRGRLAEVDVMLAALIVGAMAAFDRVRMGSSRARWAFFLLLGATALAKGVGFGAALVVASSLVVLAWDRDSATLRSLARCPISLALGIALALAWPVAVLARYPQALGLWTMHVTDRLAARSSHFAGEPWPEYLLAPILQTLPWTPFALVGAWRSARRARVEREGIDRLLWAWFAVPSVMVSLASARNSHYLIHALPPLAIWSAISLDRLGSWLRESRGRSDRRIRSAATASFLAIGLGWGIGFASIGPRLNSRDAEMAFYERAGRTVPADEPLVLLYDLERPDRWDKEPYPTPFGPVPADLAARLYSLGRRAEWRAGEAALAASPPKGSFWAIARERDRSALSSYGRVDPVLRGPTTRWDRAFVLDRIFRAPGPVPSE